MSLCNNVLKSYFNVKEIYQRFNNPITRSNVKGYLKNYDLHNSNSTTYAFKPAKNGTPLSVTVSKVKDKNFLTIKTKNANGGDIRLTLPILRGKPVTQIFVMQNDKVEKTFYIYDEKLIKFNAKSESDKYTHPDRQMYYHTQDYINKSGLDKYLKVIRERLDYILSDI